MSVDCSTKDESGCNVDACSWNANAENGQGKCLCKVGYGSAKKDATDCAPCTGNTVNTIDGTDGACSDCDTNEVGAAETGKTGNSKCVCADNYARLTTATGNCVLCNDTTSQKVESDICKCVDGYTQNDTTGACTKGGSTPATTCTNTAYTKDQTDCTKYGEGCINPTADSANKCICNSGFEAQTDGTCKATSSASPLAILLICALIISVIASVATAAVVAKRKAAARRTAEVIVSDAL